MTTIFNNNNNNNKSMKRRRILLNRILKIIWRKDLQIKKSNREMIY